MQLQRVSSNNSVKVSMIQYFSFGEHLLYFYEKTYSTRLLDIKEVKGHKLDYRSPHTI